MFYFLFVFIFLIAFFIFINKNSPHTKPLVCFLVSYFVLICSAMMYLAKDTYYYNVVSNYFFLPKKLWLWMIFLKIDRLVLIRTLNWSSLAVIFFSVRFVLSFFRKHYPRSCRGVSWAAALYSCLAALLFDPALYIKAYYSFYPQYVTPAAFIHIQSSLQTAFSVMNALILCSCIAFLFLYYLRMPRIRIIRRNLLSITVLYSLIVTSYLLLFSFTPAYLIKVSKFADSYRFLSIPLKEDVWVYNIFPYYLIVTIGLIIYSVYSVSSFRNDLSNKTRGLTKQIDASETTSKTFCHFVKNELIAIQAELEMLPGGPETQESAAEIIKRCELLYQRLDDLYRSTKTSELQLAEVEIQQLLRETLAFFGSEMERYNLVFALPEKPITALLDKVYFSQAIHNVVRNSLDAMDELGENRRNLLIRAEIMDTWIVLEISDTGKGIAQNNLDKIFQPFFSSHPFSRQWGIGLSLTYKIILAHEGHIEVESKQNVGTTVRILLPNVNKIYV